MNKTIDTIIFDMDGILFNTERLATNCWYQAAKEWEIEGIGDIIPQCMGRNENDIKDVFYKTYGKDFNYIKFKERTSELFYRYIEENGLPVMKGVYEILEYLQRKEYKIGLASSTKEKSVKAHLQRANISKYFSVVIAGDMVKHSKPDPEIYLLAVEKLKSEKEKTIAVEDSFHGIKSAYLAGIKPIMIPDMVKPTEEMKKILYYLGDSLLDLKRIL